MSLSTQHPIPSESDRLPTDSKLVVQARAGDPLAFEELFERYNERICLYLIHMVGNDAVGCELTQETFLKAWQALPGFREEARFVNWLYRIATNLADEHRRTRRTHRRDRPTQHCPRTGLFDLPGLSDFIFRGRSPTAPDSRAARHQGKLCEQLCESWTRGTSPHLHVPRER